MAQGLINRLIRVLVVTMPCCVTQGKFFFGFGRQLGATDDLGVFHVYRLAEQVTNMGPQGETLQSGCQLRDQSAETFFLFALSFSASAECRLSKLQTCINALRD